MVRIKNLSKTSPEEIPDKSKFLLEFNYDRLFKSNVHDQTYCVVVMEATVVAGKRRAQCGAQRKKCKASTHVSRPEGNGLEYLK